jgi:hypothetical protein
MPCPVAADGGTPHGAAADWGGGGLGRVWNCRRTGGRGEGARGEVRQSRPHDEVEQEGRSEGGSDASASDGKTRCGRKRAEADWYGPTDDDNILLFLVVG